MIAATRRWLRRNRNGLAIGVGVVGAAYLAGQYVIGKISEARERMALDRIAKENLRRRFEQNQTDCTFTVLALLPTVTENILETLPVEQLTHELQQKRAEKLARSGREAPSSELGSSGPSSVTDGGDSGSLSSFQSSSYVHASQIAESGSSESSQPRRTKQQLWAELKISSITRSLTLLYTLSLLTLLTRIQLNLLGRLSYISSVLSIGSPDSPSPSQPTDSRPPSSAQKISLVDSSSTSSPEPQITPNIFETNRRYLTFSWWLLHRGSSLLLSKVRTVVTEVFSSISVTEPITPTRLSDLILEVRKRIEGATDAERMSFRWLPFLLPPEDEYEVVLREAGVLTPPPSSSSSLSAVPPSQPAISPQLHSLLAQTADLIDSPHFSHIQTLLLNSAFHHLIHETVIPQSFPNYRPRSHPQSQLPRPSRPSPSVPTAPPTTSPTIPPDTSISSLGRDPEPVQEPEPSTKLASLLATMTRQAHAIGNGNHPPNVYLSRMEEDVKELEGFAAVIFTRSVGEGEIGGQEALGLEDGEDGLGLGMEIGKGKGKGRDGEREGGGVEGMLQGAWERVVGR